MSERLAKLKLSTRARELLLLIDLHSERNWETGEIEHFWVPSAYTQYLTLKGNELRPQLNHDMLRAMGVRYEIDVDGGGDAACLKGLEKKRLIERPRTSLSGKYIYVITELGRCICEDMMDEARSKI